MRCLYIFFITFFLSFYINAQDVNFPNSAFKYTLVNYDCVDTNNDGTYDSDADTNDDGEIQVSEAEAILHLNLSTGTISSLIGIEAFSNLQTLRIYNNTNLEILDITSLSNLTSLIASQNGFTTVYANDLINLEILQITNNYNNQLISIDFSGLTNIQTLHISDAQIPTLDVSALTSLQNLYLIDMGLTSINVSGLTNLIDLNCRNNSISTLDTNDLINLELLHCGYNSIATLSLSALINLIELQCHSNQLATLDVSGLSNLEILKCVSNPLTELDVSGLTNLIELECSNTQLNTIDLSGLTNLTTMNASNSQLTTLDTSMLSSLEILYLQENQLESIDLSASINLEFLNIDNNQLISMFLKNGGEITGSSNLIKFYGNPNLQYICIDDFEYESINYKVSNEYGYTNCVVNTYCNFVPGGDFYTIEGQNNFDLDDNGCDDNDPVYPNLKYSITNGIIIGGLISNSFGDYFIAVQEGLHTLTPDFENSDYYSSNPMNVTVDFPTDLSPLNQGFCLTANGSYNDLEIFIIPLERARPGFNTEYKVIYKNKGTTTLSGNVDFDLNDNAEQLDFVSSTPIADNYINNVLTWNYTDLQPFESREILITLNMNTPTETPPLNGGDEIGFKADIYPKNVDETIYDNNFQLLETVVNSFDPNDKTCLEGSIISLEQIDEYLHYLIRFENTGTASAVNIVVKDIIDISKLDISTIAPLHSSHNYWTRIKDNIVEFVFEDIQLPFDDANNDGYIAFKIKPLNTLELGDTIDNNAEIYFDFNFPIITNISEVTVAVLNTDEYELENSIKIYPNPVKDVLYLNATDTITSVEIFNLLGQQILKTIPNSIAEEINISGLYSGVYLVKVKIGELMTDYKIVKE